MLIAKENARRCCESAGQQARICAATEGVDNKVQLREPFGERHNCVVDVVPARAVVEERRSDDARDDDEGARLEGGAIHRSAREVFRRREPPQPGSELALRAETPPRLNQEPEAKHPRDPHRPERREGVGCREALLRVYLQGSRPHTASEEKSLGVGRGEEGGALAETLRVK